MKQNDDFAKRCRHIRREIMTMIAHGRRGHISSAFSVVEICTILYDYIMKYRPQEPDWPDRDRFILSKGHGCLAQYALLADKGFFSKDHYLDFCAPDGILGGHPETKVPGIEAPTGSLGHGLSLGVGYALNARLDGKSYRTYVVVGDGECNEGSVWEAAMSASKHRLSSLAVLVDYNKYMSFSTTYEVCDLEPFADKWRAFGFDTKEVDMVKEPYALKELLELDSGTDKPRAFICHTRKGQGVPFIEEDPLDWHHKSRISEEDINRVMAALEDDHA